MSFPACAALRIACSAPLLTNCLVPFCNCSFTPFPKAILTPVFLKPGSCCYYIVERLIQCARYDVVVWYAVYVLFTGVVVPHYLACMTTCICTPSIHPDQ